MIVLLSGLLVFILAHLVPAQPRLRAKLVERLGIRGYRLAFSGVALAGLVLIVVGYSRPELLGGSNPELWSPPLWTRHVTFLVMVPAMILLVAGFVPSRLRKAVRQPMLVAVALWALSHLLSNGDLASVLLFGTFLVFALHGRGSLERKAAQEPAGVKAGGPLADMLAIIGGLALYAFMLLYGHAWLIGIPLVPGWN